MFEIVMNRNAKHTESKKKSSKTAQKLHVSRSPTPNKHFYFKPSKASCSKHMYNLFVHMQSASDPSACCAKLLQEQKH